MYIQDQQATSQAAPTGTPVPPEAPLTARDPNRAIEILQAQIAGTKKEIQDLTDRLVPGQSGSSIAIIREQINAAQERLVSVEQQLDAAVSGKAVEPVTIEVAREPESIPPEVQDLLFGLMFLTAAIFLGGPLVRAIARRLEGRGKTTEDATPGHERFDRMEQAVDAIAIEVERISENQRYSTKLMNEIRALPQPEAQPLEVPVRDTVRQDASH